MIVSIIGSIIATIIIGCAIWGYNHFFSNTQSNPTANSRTHFNPRDLKLLKWLQKRKEDKLKKTYNHLKESTVFFSYRFSEAFPGCRDINEINKPSEALNHLDVLLKEPLTAEYNGRGASPIWWWRGHNNLHIRSYKRVKKIFSQNDEFIINNIQHFKMKRVVAFGHPSYQRRFVYVEVAGMEPTGLYPDAQKYEEYGEYGLLKKKYVTREEYDDGAVIIKGKPIDITQKVKLRSRVLKKYNFLVAANGSPINNSQADQIIQSKLDDILEGKIGFDDLKEYVFSLPQKH
ncbi:MAG: hypothetical protein NZ828_05660 [Alphaproteobacteria bacterium]|nr:hypothetical protein [Alphaproteobacteria bacterium]